MNLAHIIDGHDADHVAIISRGRATCLDYATSISPLGPFEKGGILIDNTGCDPQSWNNHGSINEFNGQWYVFYHRSSQGSKFNRRVCVEPITFRADGSPAPTKNTGSGRGRLGRVGGSHDRTGGAIGGALLLLAQLILEPLHVLADGSEFLLAHESHTTHCPLHLGADESDHQLPVRPALLDQVLRDALHLRGDHLRALRSGLYPLVDQVGG